jgi:prepilin peptidase CpaA
MNSTSVENMLVIILCAALVLAAVIDFWKLKVPNWLTFSLILTGWGLALLGGPEEFPLLSFGRFGASVTLTLVGFGLLLPVYMIGGMGAGDVKMQMGFGAWVGALYGLQEGFWILLAGFCLGAVVGGVIALGQMLWRGRLQQNWLNLNSILSDLRTAGSVHEVAERAAQRKPHLQLLPYGVPLCIGFVFILTFRQEVLDTIQRFVGTGA